MLFLFFEGETKRLNESCIYLHFVWYLYSVCVDADFKNYDRLFTAAVSNSSIYLNCFGNDRWKMSGKKRNVNKLVLGAGADLIQQMPMMYSSFHGYGRVRMVSIGESLYQTKSEPNTILA